MQVVNRSGVIASQRHERSRTTYMRGGSTARLGGFLTKKGGRQWKRRWFILEDHVITYFCRQGDIQPRGRMVLIAESQVTNFPTRVHAFHVITNTKTLMVYADTREERDRWVAALNQQIGGLRERALQRRRRRHVKRVRVSGTEFELDMKYEMIGPIGHGAYGVVISAQDLQSGRKVAIKKIPGAFDNLMDAKRIAREVRLLRHFNHENVMKVVDILPPCSLEDFDDVYIVSELMEMDLHRVIYSKQHLTDEHTQFFLYQILCALKYIHSASVLHRDLKPSNVLLDANCDLKLCDFGLSRGMRDDRENGDLTEYVVTRWYRAPEIMLSVQNYNEAIDVWSVGCIFGEMLGRKPLFEGQDYIHQLKLITSLIGKPSEEDLWFVRNPRARCFMLGLPNNPAVDLGLKFPHANPEAINLLSRMLILDPASRITVEQALEHPYLASLHEGGVEPLAESPVEWKGIEEVELTRHNLRLMIFDDILHYHPECRTLIQPSLAAAAAALNPANVTRSSSTPAPLEGRGVTGNAAAASTAGVANNASRLPAPASGAALTPPAPRENEEGLEGVPAWPPNEAVAPTGGLGTGISPGAAGWTGDGTTDHSVTLAGVSRD